MRWTTYTKIRDGIDRFFDLAGKAELVLAIVGLWLAVAAWRVPSWRGDLFVGAGALGAVGLALVLLQGVGLLIHRRANFSATAQLEREAKEKAAKSRWKDKPGFRKPPRMRGRRIVPRANA